MKKPIEKKPTEKKSVEKKPTEKTPVKKVIAVANKPGSVSNQSHPGLVAQQHHFSDHKTNENLYVCINDITLKRKYLLESLKSSLILQEEREKIIHIRAEKIRLLNQIRKEMESLNSKYQGLRKLLPNVKNIISYTEKELTELDSQVDMLKADLRTKTRELEVDEKTRQNLQLGMGLNHGRRKNQNNSNSEVKTGQVELKKPLTKLDRIQNNLKLIESKLKHI